jgi:ribonucleoside-diphosphate reductase beta chain
MKTPQQLYEDWERAHWAAQDIDLSGDGEHWRSMDESERNLLYWVLSSLMVAEERISTQFCGLVLAQDDEEEGSYLSTQLVDENRHMQFYARFQNEVVADAAAIGRTWRAPARCSATRSARSSTRRSSRPTTACGASRTIARPRWTS